ncbi:MAG: hypothetical protein CMP95_01500 [Gammaproteobacteria bacterium]|nr:hypothetical protein [Gammaproteobacteria bacterium]
MTNDQTSLTIRPAPQQSTPRAAPIVWPRQLETVNRAEVEGRAGDMMNGPERGNKTETKPLLLRSGQQGETRAKQGKG